MPRQVNRGQENCSQQQNLLRIAKREKGGWEVVKCYLSDDLASSSGHENQLSRARREAAANKKKRKTNKQKDRKEQFRNAPLPPPPPPPPPPQKKNPKSLANHTRDTVV